MQETKEKIVFDRWGRKWKRVIVKIPFSPDHYMYVMLPN